MKPDGEGVTAPSKGMVKKTPAAQFFDSKAQLIKPFCDDLDLARLRRSFSSFTGGLFPKEKGGPKDIFTAYIQEDKFEKDMSTCSQAAIRPLLAGGKCAWVLRAGKRIGASSCTTRGIDLSGQPNLWWRWWWCKQRSEAANATPAPFLAFQILLFYILGKPHPRPYRHAGPFPQVGPPAFS
eukprot:2809244-Amphidinium_carterae.1